MTPTVPKAAPTARQRTTLRDPPILDDTGLLPISPSPSGIILRSPPAASMALVNATEREPVPVGVSSSKTYFAVNHEDGPVAVSVVAAWTRTAPLIGPGWLAIETPARSPTLRNRRRQTMSTDPNAEPPSPSGMTSSTDPRTPDAPTLAGREGAQVATVAPCLDAPADPSRLSSPQSSWSPAAPHPTPSRLRRPQPPPRPRAAQRRRSHPGWQRSRRAPRLTSRRSPSRRGRTG